MTASSRHDAAPDSAMACQAARHEAANLVGATTPVSRPMSENSGQCTSMYLRQRALQAYERAGSQACRAEGVQITLLGAARPTARRTETGARIGGYLEPSVSTPRLTRMSAA
jgi:hypothetical protein